MSKNSEIIGGKMFLFSKFKLINLKNNKIEFVKKEDFYILTIGKKLIRINYFLDDYEKSKVQKYFINNGIHFIDR